MLVASFILILIGAVCLLTDMANKDNIIKWWRYMTICLSLIIGGMLVVGYAFNTSEVKFHSVRKTMTSEILVKTLNGAEVSRDTIYIFTPKKK